MPEILQQLCQNTYYSVFHAIIAFFGRFLKLLNTHENGHICSITDEMKRVLMI
jgi:hypothetical protein